MKNLINLTAILIATVGGGLFSANAQTEFWSEDFGTGCNQGQLAHNFGTANGTWTVSATGTNASLANNFFISATEQIGAGNCGTGCGGANDRTLHVSNVSIFGGIIPADGGALYNAGGFFFNGTTNRRAESPVIDCSEYTDVSIQFDYIEFGQGSSDNATLWYFDGATWSLLEDLSKTTCCGGSCNGSNQGLFAGHSVDLPASADNNPNVRLGFHWTNNNDGAGTDPSFAVDNISVSGSFVLVEEVDPPANNECIDAVDLTVTTYPDVDNTLGTLYGATNGGGASCAASADGGDVYYTFTAPVENHYIVNVNPFQGADVVVEVLDACGGVTENCTNNGITGVAESALLLNLDPGNYVIRVHNADGVPEAEGSSGFLVNVQQFPLAGVQDDANNPLFACDQGGFQLEDFVGATPQTSPGVIDYEWLVAEEGGGAQTIWQRGEPNYVSRCEWLSMEYGKTYNVFVRVLVDHPQFGQIWGVFQGDYQNPNTPGASNCTMATSPDVTPTELRPNYTPTNALGNDYGLCDFAIAFNVSGSENFRWRFDGNGTPGDAEDVIYTRGIGNPSVRLSWVNNLIPGFIYNVAVEVQVAGQWSGYSTVLPITLALPPNDVEIRPQFCGGTYAPNGYILAESVCEADLYQFRFTPEGGGAPSFRNSGNYVCFMSAANPPLSPGDYDVQVKVTQNGVPGDWGPVCPITIAGPQGQQSQTPTLRDIEVVSGAMLFPNPNAGEEVRVNLDGLSDGNHEVMIQVYNVLGKQVSNEWFGHEGNSLSRLVRFDGKMVTGMYLVQITVDGERFATERLIIK